MRCQIVINDDEVSFEPMYCGCLLRSMQTDIFEHCQGHLTVVSILEAEHWVVLMIDQALKHSQKLGAEDLFAILCYANGRQPFAGELAVVCFGVKPLPLVAPFLHHLLSLLARYHMKDTAPASLSRIVGVVELLQDPVVADSLAFEFLNEGGMFRLNVAVNPVVVDDGHATIVLCMRVAVETHKLRTILGLITRVVEGYRLARQAFVRHEDLQFFVAFCTNNQMASVYSSKLEHSEAKLMQH